MGRLKEIIREKNMKIGGIARSLDVNVQTITNWDDGRTEPGVSQFAILADLLGESFDGLRKKLYKKSEDIDL